MGQVGNLSYLSYTSWSEVTWMKPKIEATTKKKKKKGEKKKDKKKKK